MGTRPGYTVPTSDEDNANRKDAIVRLWKVSALLSVKAFGWIGFLNRLPSKDQLRKRGVISSSNGLSCVLCFQFVENLDHVFVLIAKWKKLCGRRWKISLVPIGGMNVQRGSIV